MKRIWQMFVHQYSIILWLVVCTFFYRIKGMKRCIMWWYEKKIALVFDLLILQIWNLLSILYTYVIHAALSINSTKSLKRINFLLGKKEEINYHCSKTLSDIAIKSLQLILKEIPLTDTILFRYFHNQWDQKKNLKIKCHTYLTRKHAEYVNVFLFIL
jgi:hypothetical protein